MVGTLQSISFKLLTFCVWSLVIWMCQDPPSKDRTWWLHHSLACLYTVSGPHGGFAINIQVVGHTRLLLCKPPSLPMWTPATPSLFPWKPLQSSPTLFLLSHTPVTVDVYGTQICPCLLQSASCCGFPVSQNRSQILDSTQEVFCENAYPPFQPSLCHTPLPTPYALAFCLIPAPCTIIYSLWLLVSVPSSTCPPSSGGPLIAT